MAAVSAKKTKQMRCWCRNKYRAECGSCAVRFLIFNIRKEWLQKCLLALRNYATLFQRLKQRNSGPIQVNEAFPKRHFPIVLRILRPEYGLSCHLSLVLSLRESQTEAGVGAGDVLEQLIRVFTDHGLLVVAGDVVPRDAIVVHVVEHAQAGLRRLVDVELSVVRLPLLLVPGLRPRVVAPAVGDLEGDGIYLQRLILLSFFGVVEIKGGFR